MAVPPRNVPLPVQPQDVPRKGTYTIVSARTIWGKPGDDVELELTENQELSLLQSGAVKRKEAAAETDGVTASKRK